MVPSYAFILSAGFGTRMGEYGKSLPKPLWPIFEKTQLEFHILNLLDIGVSKIYVNAHHQSEKVQKTIDIFNKEEVELVHEKELLGSGGAFHNLSRKTGISSPMYSLNVDVFYGLTDEDIKRGMQKISHSQASAYLYAVGINKGDPYNRFKVEKGQLVDIVPPANDAPNVTFSGCALVDMSYMGSTEGASQFFKTVANYQGQTVLVDESCHDKCEYWDFGTLENYLLSHKKLLQQQSSTLFKKLVSFGAVKEKECTAESYRAPVKSRVINMSQLTSNEIDELNISEALLLPGVNADDIHSGHFEETNEGKVYFPKSD